MNFNEISIDEVTGLTSASKFGVEDVETYKNIGGADPLTFMGSDSITLRIMDVNGNLLGTGTLSIPGEYGEYPFTVTLVNV